LDPTGRVLWTKHTYLGPSLTNNVAEYSALIECLQQAVRMRLPRLCIQGDSQLVLKQVEGTYQVKNEGMKTMHTRAMALLRQLPAYHLEHIPRALNARADELANLAMDTRTTEQRMP
jgi:ribonuclease HI